MAEVGTSLSFCFERHDTFDTKHAMNPRILRASLSSAIWLDLACSAIALEPVRKDKNETSTVEAGVGNEREAGVAIEAGTGTATLPSAETQSVPDSSGVADSSPSQDRGETPSGAGTSNMVNSSISDSGIVSRTSHDAEDSGQMNSPSKGEFSDASAPMTNEGDSGLPLMCAPGWYLTSGRCLPLTVCSSGEYVSREPTDTQDRGCSSCEPGSFSLSDNSAACAAHSTCSPGTYVIEAGTSSRDTECGNCPNGYFSTQQNAVQCTPHTTCDANYDETRPASSTQDRQCECQQTCDDGRCIAANACCEPTADQQTFILPTSSNNSVEYAFCIEFDAEITFSGGAGGPPDSTPPQVFVKLDDAIGGGIYADGPTNQLNGSPVPIEAGSYILTLGVTAGNGSGGAQAVLKL